MLIDLAPPAAPADALTEVADQLRLPFGFADDDDRRAALRGAVEAALAMIEARTGRALLRRTFRFRVGAWEAPGSQTLPIAPAVSVEALLVEDDSGLRTGADVSTLRLDLSRATPRICARAPAALPPIPAGGYGEITFVAGHGETLAAAPADLRRATVLLAAALHEGWAAASEALPFAVAALVEPYRTVRL